MTFVSKILAGLLIAACVFGGFLFQRNRALKQNLAAEQAKVQVLEHSLVATQNSLNTYVARAKATTERQAKNQKELTRALESNQDWRDQPVPDAVYHGLYGHRTPATARSATR